MDMGFREDLNLCKVMVMVYVWTLNVQILGQIAWPLVEEVVGGVVGPCTFLGESSI